MLFLSIKPQYVKKILCGDKQVELRRRKPRSVPGDWLAIYESSPTMALVAVTQITNVMVTTPCDLWPSVKDFSGVTKQQFDGYFTGSSKAVGIMLQPPLRLCSPVLLSELRIAWPRFNPPQGFLYLSDNQEQFVMDRVMDGKQKLKHSA